MRETQTIKNTKRNYIKKLTILRSLLLKKTKHKTQIQECHIIYLNRIEIKKLLNNKITNQNSIDKEIKNKIKNDII